MYRLLHRLVYRHYIGTASALHRHCIGTASALHRLVFGECIGKFIGHYIELGRSRVRPPLSWQGSVCHDGAVDSRSMVAVSHLPAGPRPVVLISRLG